MGGTFFKVRLSKKKTEKGGV